ncbi:GNAT family N-acetyltransferase [Streptomyces sp. TLI_105]|uniref:GNAT family N-acetyltransferase n=1 Tax=Streptomyces sp. TLI_105 TaxID=1881019 RepID=UPI00089D4A72|nr:GNAT family N-acetyltransferase [Streptomyces sp. TLI_105]SEE20146.1 Protein N-acetyltransferase, RimJ/RimL family [Streptomyces sp. TLI_105]
MSVLLSVASTAALPALRLRAWHPDDAEALVAAHRDPALRRWLITVIDSEADARRWIDDQRRGWAAGTRFGFAVLADDGAGFGPPVGHVGVKPKDDGAAEVGYWTAAEARGRGLASRALEAAVRWVLTEGSAPPAVRFELFHAVDNSASCHVAERCGFGLEAVLPAQPPVFPTEGHLHVRGDSARP